VAWCNAVHTHVAHHASVTSVLPDDRLLLRVLLQEAIRRALEENPELAEQLGEAAMAKVCG
jgi:hypothetical protein